MNARLEELHVPGSETYKVVVRRSDLEDAVEVNKQLELDLDFDI